MKKYILIAIPLSLVILSSCGSTTENKNLTKLKEEKSKIKAEIEELKTELAQIDDKIALLDTTKKENLPLVTTAISVQKPFAERVTFQGTIEADKNVMVSPETNGVIEAIYVKEGDRVSAGSRLAKLDSDILNQNIAEIEKSLELANYMFEKQKALREKGVGTEVEFEQAKNQKESLERKLKSIKTQAGKSYVYSPISGYVDEIFPNLGELASPQMAMFRVLNLNNITIKSEISEDYLTSIKSGSKVSVYFPSIDYRLNNLSITRTGKYINPSNRTFPISIDVPNKDGKILPNLLSEVEVVKTKSDSAILIPSASIYEDSKGVKFCYTLTDENIAKKQLIKVDYVQGDTTKIKEGVKPGAEIVVRGASALVDGDKVKVAAPKSEK